MLGIPVETLYFDVLQFLYHLALAILVGGALVLGTSVAPALFATARSRADAGTLFAGVLARFDGYAVLAVLVLAATSLLKATAFEVTGSPEPRLVARWAALALLGAATAGFDDLPQAAAARAEFARLHERSRRAMSVAVIAGLVALFLS